MFIYSAFDPPDGHRSYTGEALVSATSLRRHTDWPIRLYTNTPSLLEPLEARPGFPFSEVVPIAGDAPPKAFKIRSLATLGEADGVYLDCDTVVLDDISKVFAIAPFDIAGVITELRDPITSMAAAVEHEATQRYWLNSGVLFVRGGFGPRLSERWLAVFEDTVRKHGPRILDQLSLRGALQALGADVRPLPANYNFRLKFGGMLAGACFVVHTHYWRDLARLKARGFPAEEVDALIDHVARINATMAFESLPPRSERSLLAQDLRRWGWRGPPLALRLQRAFARP